ncbi:hypothetical protein OG333_16010 [Streptomyces anulatus]|uniref:hypothetical protein n=1 Tax=Streptomyces TaxID=1883 RepID=UPI000BEF7141|nr:hypothetical protein [Streptomyces sp. or20]WSV75766.1 hypothetical protein OG333_16010 [Streptomyces anulatus]
MPSEDDLPFEDGLGAELRRAGETFELSGRGAVVDGALERGRRTVRRRRAAAVAGSVLTLALVGGGVTFATGQLSASGDVAGVANSGPAAPTAATFAPTSVAESRPAPPSPAPAASAAKDTGKPSAPAKDTGAQAPVLDYTLLMPTFRALLPEGLSVGEETDTGGEFASVVVDDGEGRSLVQINVQADMRDVADDLYGEATTLPDGTLLATSKEPGEKGGAGVVQWTADTMRPDGMRVVVSAFNSGAQSTPATRPEPALTMDQLVALATGPQWLELQAS